MDLRSARKKQGWTLEHVGRLIGGVAPTTVARHEKGSRYPGPDEIERYLAIYAGDVTEDDIRKTHRDWRKRSSPPAQKEPTHA